MAYSRRGGLHIVDIEQAEIRRAKIVQLGNLTMGQWYARQTDKPDYMINASLWDEQGPIGTIWLDGELVRDEGTGFGFGIAQGGSCGFGRPWQLDWQDYITGYPSLIEYGSPTAYTVDSYVQNARTKRAAVAGAGGHLYLIAGESMNVEDFRQALITFGAYNAINLDGGGSARLMVGGEAVNSPSDDRACKLAIAIWMQKKEEKPVQKKVFLGVGHGGSDSGAVGHIVEKDANLMMAAACADELRRHGVDVLMSRVKDEDDTLSEEIQECNAFGPDLAVDVHNNAGGGDGFEAYYSIVGGIGKQLAQNIEAEVKAIGQNSRGCKTRENSAGRDYYGFIRETVCPAVICEGVFVDNAADAAQADSADKQAAFGKAYARGILTTLGIKHLPEGDAPEDAGEKQHWAQGYYDSLNQKGVTIHETRFDDPITRGEVFALLDQVVKERREDV